MLAFYPGTDFQDLNDGDTRDVLIDITATDRHGEMTTNTVTVAGADDNLQYDFILNGIDTNDKSGSSVSSAGDVNGDGVDDILIGARDADPSGSSSGETYVVFGKNAASEGDFAASFDLSTLDGTDGFALNGVDDILIGALRASQGGSSFAGEAYVVYGKDTATDGEFVASLDLGTLDGVTGFTLNGLDDINQTGRSVSSAGDVNGDGIDDILIGAYFAETDQGSSVGKTYVVYGGNSSLKELDALDGADGQIELALLTTSDLDGLSV